MIAKEIRKKNNQIINFAHAEDHESFANNISKSKVSQFIAYVTTVTIFCGWLEKGKAWASHTVCAIKAFTVHT